MVLVAFVVAAVAYGVSAEGWKGALIMGMVSGMIATGEYYDLRRSIRRQRRKLGRVPSLEAVYLVESWLIRLWRRSLRRPPPETPNGSRTNLERKVPDDETITKPRS